MSKLKSQLDKISESANKIKDLNFAASHITAFSKAVDQLNNIKTPNLTKLNSQMKKLSEIASEYNGITVGGGGLSGFVSEINTLSNISVPNLTKLNNQIIKLRGIADTLNTMPDIRDNTANIIAAIKPFETLGKNNINSFLRSLERLPEVSKALNTMDLDGFSKSLTKITSQITPLANAMDKLGRGYSVLPSNIKRVISSNQQLAESSKKLEKSKTSLTSVIGETKIKLLALFFAYTRISSVLGDCLASSNEYVENLNLFTVAMGDSAKEALNFAEKVNDLLGIDVSEWIRNQGVFKQITTGFGVVEEKANLMSKNLTQLGYDIASFFNISTEESMQKLQSGISGELEPLRRLGYALDAATLQQIAYDHGIQQNINTMTQAQKSQLRYLAIMEQSKNSMGDMARTIVTPANSMRILNQQFEQLKRAVGNVVSVFAVKLIPYIQVAVRLLTDLANELAAKWGFELPEIDYSGSGLSSITDEMSDLSDDANTAKDNVTDMIKEVQRLAGFDELNILNRDKEDTGSGKNAAAEDISGLTDWNIDLPEYDFLAGLDEQTNELYEKAKKKLGEIIDKFKNLKKWIEKNKSILEALATVFGGLWAVSKVKKFLGFIKDIYDWFKKLKIVQDISRYMGAFIEGFKGSNASTFFGKFNDGAKKAREGMKKLTKVVGTLVGTAMSSVGSYNLFKDLTSDTLTWKAALSDSLLIVGGLATSWIFGGLPGLGIAAVTSAFTAMIGAANGAKDASDRALEKCLDSEWKTAGTNISDFANNFTELTAKIISAETEINESYSSLDSLKQSIQNVGDSIRPMLDSFVLGEEDTNNINDLKNKFKELEDQTRRYSDNAINSLQTYVNANTEFIKAVGGDVEKINNILEEAKTNASSQIDEISAKIDEITSKENMSSSDIAQLKTLYDRLAAITGIDIGPTTSSLESLNNEIGILSKTDINLESFKTTQTAVSNIADSLTNAQSQINSAKGNIEATIDSLAIDNDKKQYLKDTFSSVFEMKEQDLRKIAEGLEPVKDELNRFVSSALEDIENGHTETFGQFLSDSFLGTDLSDQDIEKAKQDFLNKIGFSDGENFIKNAVLESGMSLSDYEKLFNLDAAKEAEKSIFELSGQEVKNRLVNSMGEAGLDAADEFTSNFNDTVSSAFSGSNNPLMNIISGKPIGKKIYGETVKTFEQEVMSQSFKFKASVGILGKNFTEGFAEGIAFPQSKNRVLDNSGSIAKAAVSKIQSDLDMHSPSRVAANLGLNFTLGFGNGIVSGLSVIIVNVNAITNMMRESLSSIDLTDTGKTVGESFSNGFSNGLAGVVNACNDTLRNYESFEVELMNAYNDAVPAFQTMMNGISAVVGAAMGQIESINYTANGRQIPGYATGGFPSRADLFLANEDGRPEMIGRIGSKTAVANTDQIIVGIANGVKQAILETGGINRPTESGGQQGDIYVFIDSEEVSYRVERRTAAKAKRTGGG